jgi:ribosomal protein S12 methylthiotransferase
VKETLNKRRVSFVSLGCPKALVDSEQIITELLDNGCDIVAAEEPSEVTVINTCGFIDTAKAESFATIEQALTEQREVIVTGCLGAQRDELLERFPQLKFVSGPADVAPVIAAVEHFVPAKRQAKPSPREVRERLTPAHYAYLKISEGCNHTCSFCIIPDMRGKLRSRPIDSVLHEANALVAQGTKELLVVAQDLSAYGVDLKYASADVDGEVLQAKLDVLCDALGDIAPWVRLHYVYPYPSVDHLIPLMAVGKVLPYLDIPLQHASPKILKAMRRPAAAEKALERINRWREICPELAIRSTFIVGFPGETPDDVGLLLDFLEEAQLDRVGCFTYSSVDGARANTLEDPIDEVDKLDRQEMVYELQANISAARLNRHIGQELQVIVDEGGQNAEGIAIGRSKYDAPEIDGTVHISGAKGLRAGEFAQVKIDRHDDHDLYGHWIGQPIQIH